LAQREHVGVVEPADAAQRAEVVVEGTVLLHQHDDVLDVADGAVLGLAGEDALDVGRQQRGRDGASSGARGALEEA
jgi:hypothetical protein